MGAINYRRTDSQRRTRSKKNENKFERARGTPLCSDECRAAVEKTWRQAPGAARAIRRLRGSGADGQSAFFERDAAHGRSRALAVWCTASQVFRSALRSSWKSFSRLVENSKEAIMATTKVAIAPMKVAQIPKVG